VDDFLRHSFQAALNHLDMAREDLEVICMDISAPPELCAYQKTLGLLVENFADALRPYNIVPKYAWPQKEEE